MSIDPVTGAGSSINTRFHFVVIAHPKGLSLNTVAKVIMNLSLITAIDSVIVFCVPFAFKRLLTSKTVLFSRGRLSSHDEGQPQLTFTEGLLCDRHCNSSLHMPLPLPSGLQRYYPHSSHRWGNRGRTKFSALPKATEVTRS